MIYRNTNLRKHQRTDRGEQDMFLQRKYELIIYSSTRKAREFSRCGEQHSLLLTCRAYCRAGSVSLLFFSMLGPKPKMKIKVQEEKLPAYARRSWPVLQGTFAIPQRVAGEFSIPPIHCRTGHKGCITLINFR